MKFSVRSVHNDSYISDGSVSDLDTSQQQSLNQRMRKQIRGMSFSTIPKRKSGYDEDEDNGDTIMNDAGKRMKYMELVESSST